MSNHDELVYWITERDKIRQLKERHVPPPWSPDEVFRTTYFCNVRREDDKVTKWIRSNFPPRHRLPELNMMIARMVNKPYSLGAMGWPFHTWGESARYMFLLQMAKKGAWGSAYIVSTNGRPMAKHTYVQGLLTAAVAPLTQVAGATTLAGAHVVLQGIQGIGSFMSGQIIADLKNTKGHPLTGAEDWWSWCAHGPGSLRGMAWLMERTKCTPTEFYANIATVKRRVELDLEAKGYQGVFCMQDFQNCLCEYDKYMRVSRGTGRSKRKYNGG